MQFTGMINYITNLRVEEHGGGWSGMNHNVYNQIKEKNKIALIENINPKYNLTHRIFSKLARVLGFRGIFPAFTNERLSRIKSLVEVKMNPKSKMNFFHGATPWLNVRSGKKYAVYLDACFATYVQVYQPREKFNKTQLRRLYQKEANFLNNSFAVFFSSRWALDEARRKYNIPGNNFHVAGLGGGLHSSVAGNETTENYFLFIGLDFEGKGGGDVVHAFNEIRKEYSNFKLKIAGAKPPDTLLYADQIEYLGYIDKTTQEGAKQLIDLFSHAYCFVLPTTKDITPLVLVEAGSVGCPVISTRCFGIPEIVINEETGILLDPEKNIRKQLAIAMGQLCANRTMRDAIGKNAEKHIKNNFTWHKTGVIINSILAGAVNNSYD
jgi:glycosyltransferase involved in cell wall biosynthesis